MGFQRELAPFGRVFRGNAPKSPLASGEIPLAVKNGAGGEETDRFPSEGKSSAKRNFQTMLCIVLNNDRPSLFQSHSKFVSKMCQWHIFDVTLL